MIGKEKDITYAYMQLLDFIYDNYIIARISCFPRIMWISACAISEAEDIMAVRNVTPVMPEGIQPAAVVRRLLTIPQVAQQLGVSTRKTWRLIAEGRIRAVRVGTRGTRVMDGDLDNFITGLPGQSVD